MIILGFDDIENELLKQKNRFEDNIIILNTTDFINKQDNDVNKYPLNFLQVVKSEYKAGNFIFIKYDKDVPSFLTAIKLPYKILITKELQENGNLPAINNVEVLEDISEILTILKNYDWYIEEKNETSDVSLIPNEHKVLTLQKKRMK